jgi:hypothetical protein
MGTTREAVEPITRAFPETAGNLLTLADQVDDLVALRRSSAKLDDREGLEILRRLYQALRLLSTTAAMRVRLSGDTVTLATLDEDKFRCEFRARYEAVRVARWRALGLSRPPAQLTASTADASGE